MQYVHVNVDIHLQGLKERGVVFPVIISDYMYVMACSLIRTNVVRACARRGEGRGLPWELWQVYLTEFLCVLVDLDNMIFFFFLLKACVHACIPASVCVCDVCLHGLAVCMHNSVFCSAGCAGVRLCSGCT